MIPIPILSVSLFQQWNWLLIISFPDLNKCSFPLILVTSVCCFSLSSFVITFLFLFIFNPVFMIVLLIQVIIFFVNLLNCLLYLKYIQTIFNSMQVFSPINLINYCFKDVFSFTVLQDIVSLSHIPSLLPLRVLSLYNQKLIVAL